MIDTTHWRLRPLRIPAGWLVKWNSFCDIDPAALSEEELKILSEDVLLLVNEHLGVLIDLGWYGLDKCEYRVGAFRYFEDKEQMRDSGSHPLREFSSRSTDEIANKIDDWLHGYSDGSYKVPAMRWNSKGDVE